MTARLHGCSMHKPVAKCSASPFAAQYDAKLCGYLEEYDRAFIVHADNVGSKQFMDIRAVRLVSTPAVCAQSLYRRISCACTMHSPPSPRPYDPPRLCHLRRGCRVAGLSRIVPSPGSPRHLSGAHGQEHHDEALHPAVLRALGQ